MEVALPTDRSTREIIGVCAKHGLAYGSPDNLVTFMRALHENKHLAMDFWSLVARLTKENADGATEPDWLLQAIVEGVTGHSVAEISAAPGAQRLLVRKLANLLAGQDLAGQDDVQGNGMDAPPDLVGESDSAESGRHYPAPKVASDVASVRRATEADPSISPSESALVIDGPNPILTPDEKPRPLLDPVMRFAAAQELSLREREHDRTMEHDRHIENDRPIAIPLAGYADASADGLVSGKTIGGVLLIALVVGGGIFFANDRNSSGLDRFSDSIRVGYGSAIATWHAQQSAQSGKPSGRNGNPASTDPASASQTKPARNIADQSSAQQGSAPLTQAIRSQRQTKPDTPPSDRSRLADGNGSPQITGTSEPYGGSRIVVPAEEMQDRLISSRVPVNPTGERSQGRVVLEAIVTARGTVRHLHVIQGDPALRRAAIDAAATWHYQPYLQNNTPVDVSTTITVDFSGNN